MSALWTPYFTLPSFQSAKFARSFVRLRGCLSKAWQESQPLLIWNQEHLSSAFPKLLSPKDRRHFRELRCCCRYWLPRLAGFFWMFAHLLWALTLASCYLYIYHSPLFYSPEELAAVAGQGPDLADQVMHLRLDLVSMAIGCQSLALGARFS